MSLITEPLGLYGWKDREAVVLASLLSEEPLLLVGGHGCAKSFLLERLAQSLGLEFRFYNASLINYDDLVGIPMPNKARTSLDYIASENSIWDAQVVFFDEINRTRPDLQNKLFPIIHEKRIQGRPLERLVFRWAAMNPPSLDDDTDQSYTTDYLGAEPLDPALADRFPFIMDVPAWDDLDEADQRRILVDQFAGRHEFPLAIDVLMRAAKERFQMLVKTESERLSPFVIVLVAKLHEAHFDVSTRRACILLRVILAVHAARQILAAHRSEADEVQLRDSVFLAVRSALPDRARRHVRDVEIAAVCKAAWSVAAIPQDDPVRSLLLVSDPMVRLEKAVRAKDALPPHHLATIVGEGVAAARPVLRRGLALAVYLALRERADLPATTIELLVNEIKDAILPSSHHASVPMARAAIPRTVGAQIAAVAAESGADSELASYHANLLNSLLPDGYATGKDVKEVSDEFVRLWREFSL